MLPANTPQLMRVRAVGEFKHLFDTRGKALRQRKLFDFTSVLFPRHAASRTGAGAHAENCLGSCQSFRIPGAGLF
jgi:hypothetical protein